MKEYKVKKSDFSNLKSMYEDLECEKVVMNKSDNINNDEYYTLLKKITEIENLLRKANCIGALVDYETIKTIRKVKKQRRIECFLDILNIDERIIFDAIRIITWLNICITCIHFIRIICNGGF